MRSIKEQIKKCNAEIARLKNLIPGLRCSNEMMTDRSQLSMMVGFIEEDWVKFYVDSQCEEPQVIASRLLECYREFLTRLQDNVNALEEIVNGN